MPLVSIGMPVFNCERTVESAIDSLLKQSFADFELIISDNASTDRTSSICQEYANKDSRILYIKQPANMGPVANLKFVFDQGKGRYFLWAAGDDIRSSDFLEENVKFLETHADYIASTCPNCFEGQDPVDGNLVTFEIVGTVEQRFQQFFENCWQSHAIFYSLFHKKALCDCKVLNQDFFAIDWVIDLFLIKQGNIHRTNRGLTIFGKSGGSNSSDPWDRLRNSFIEWIIPFNRFNKHVWELFREFSFLTRIKILKSLLKLNLSVSYRPLLAFVKRIIHI